MADDPLAGITALLDQGIREFNIGRYWHAHEDWEKAWMRLSGPEKTYLQGLIQASAVFYLLERRRLRPALALAGTAVGKIEASAGGEIPADRRLEIPEL